MSDRVVFLREGAGRDSGGRIVIHDVAGRRVAALPWVGARVEWDGRDEAGRELPSGAYFYRLEGVTASEGGRVLLLR